MGLLITLYLISTNVYGSTEAPPNRGFSNIELWITGTQICILLAILEYSIILFGPQANQYFTTEYYKFSITKKVFS